MGYQMTFANSYMTNSVGQSQETAGVLAALPATKTETAGTVAELPKAVEEFTQEVDMNQVACATKPKGVGKSLDIGGSDTSGSTAGTIACSASSTGSVGGGSGAATAA